VLGGAAAARVTPGVVAAVADRRGVVYEGAFGTMRSTPETPIRADAIFRVFSMTKLVTSLAVMLLVEEGRIELDAGFADYVPDYRQPDLLVSFNDTDGSYVTRPAATRITVRQLLTHTAGYGYWFLDRPLFRLTHGAPDLLNPPFLMHPPGERFAYSSGTDVLGQIIEPVSGLALDAFFAERIFAPLGMSDTGYALPPDASRLVAVNARRGGSFQEQPLEQSGVTPSGGYGLYSTAADYLRLLRLFLGRGELDGRRLIRAARIDEMTSNQIGALFAQPQTTAFLARTNDFIFMDGTQKFGFGVMVETRDQPRRRHAGAYGWGGILNTYFWVDPRAGIAAVIMMQTSPFADAESVGLCERFEAAVYGELAAGHVPR